MSLDQNLFTLHLSPHKEYLNVIDLIDPSSGTVHYRKQRVSGAEYKIEVYDPLSGSLLIAATAPSPTSKVKTLELRNPTKVVELKYTGTISFRWGFKWEEHEFEWKREECFMLRKPDPPVLVAVTREQTGKTKMTSVQILDYNLNRFDIDDRKGLEIVILTALLTFTDASEAPPLPTNNPWPNAAQERTNLLPIATADPSSDAPPKPPPKPAPKTGVDRIAELQAIRGEYNEVTVEDEGLVQDYAQYCTNLLSDDAMLFITVKSAEAAHVSKVLKVVEETKRIRHKNGISEEEELHQYVLYDTKDKRKGPRRIKLDDEDKDKNKYTPPNSLTIHLSKISMPELRPRIHPSDKSKKEGKKVLSHLPTSPPEFNVPTNKLTRPHSSYVPQPPVPPSNHNTPTFPISRQRQGLSSPHPPNSGPIPPWAQPNPSSNPASTSQSRPIANSVVSSIFDILNHRR